MRIQPTQHLKGEIKIPGDKSISHRGIMLGSLAEGLTEINGFLEGADCLSTIACFKQMGIPIERTGDKVLVHGKGLHGLSAPTATLDVGNSGTTFRLMSGILAAQPFRSTLTGDASIQQRPMKRITIPLRQMGASMDGKEDGLYAPITINGQQLTGLHYESPVASAQVKSSILLAGLYADGKTKVTEPFRSRDHSERMLQYFGHELEIEELSVTSAPCKGLYGQKVVVPGDISSAAFFLVAGSIVPNSEILLKNVGINPTRDGVLEVLKNMNADITYLNEHMEGREPVADLLVKTSNLKGTVVQGSQIPRLIDEVPAIAIAACFAEGQTIIKDAAELKVKESNRIKTMVDNLTKMGADIRETEDGMIINGTGHLKGATLESYHDHRIAMAFAIAGLVAEGETEILNSDIVQISYPTFWTDIKNLSR